MLSELTFISINCDAMMRQILTPRSFHMTVVIALPSVPSLDFALVQERI